MKKTAALTIVVILALLLCSCAKIDYPPRPLNPVSPTPASVDSQATPVGGGTAGGGSPLSGEQRLRRFDITPKPFGTVQNYYEEPQLLAYGSDNTVFRLDADFNSPQHYRIGIEAARLGEETAVIALMFGEERLCVYYVDSEETRRYDREPMYFTEGTAVLTFEILRGAARVERVYAENTSPISTARFNTSANTLSHGAPSAEAAALFALLNSQYGARAFTAQHCSVNTNAEIDAVFAATGRYPAVRFGSLTADYEREVTLAKQWAAKGGIVGYVWEPGASGAESEAAFSAEIDLIAPALSELADAGIPVLFMPMPDAGSRIGWWSGEDGGYTFTKLWEQLFARLVNHYALNNLIWIYSGGDRAYYPGSGFVDIVSESVFRRTAGVPTGTEAARLSDTAGYGRLPVMVGASSGLPSPDALARDNAGWLMWALYRGDFVINSVGEVLPDVADSLTRFYNHELTIALDELSRMTATS